MPLLAPAARCLPTLAASGDYGRGVAVQSDQRILVVGYTGTFPNDDFALARFEVGGALDTTCGTGGRVITPVGNGTDTAYSVAVQSDGKVVVAGYSYRAPLLTRVL